VTSKSLTLDVSSEGTGKVLLDGVDISESLTGVDIKIRAGKATEITLHARVDIEGDVKGEIQ
jgi:hypothetical protein